MKYIISRTKKEDEVILKFGVQREANRAS